MQPVKAMLAGRPVWANALLAFCAYMTIIYMPFDMFIKPVAEDREVWFGFMLEGWWAKATEPLHWIIYGAGMYGFWHMKSWLWPWASLYVVQVAIGMLVWSVLYRGNWIAGLVAGGVFLALAIFLWRARTSFSGRKLGEPGVVSEGEAEAVKGDPTGD